MPATERLHTEREFHDQQADYRRRIYAADGQELIVNDEGYLNHESWIRPAFEALGEVRGLRVLDFGCGHGIASIVLARRGARVTAFDLSPGYLHEAMLRFRLNGVAVQALQADGNRLPFADASFDRIWGNAILHHLEMDRAALELKRILAPGGIAVFCEPCGENPVLNWARRRMHYPEKHRTPDEEPLRRSDLQALRRVFPQMRVRGFQFLSMTRRFVRQHRLNDLLDRVDRLLLSRPSRLHLLCRYLVLTLPRSA